MRCRCVCVLRDAGCIKIIKISPVVPSKRARFRVAGRLRLVFCRALIAVRARYHHLSCLMIICFPMCMLRLCARRLYSPREKKNIFDGIWITTYRFQYSSHNSAKCSYYFKTFSPTRYFVLNLPRFPLTLSTLFAVAGYIARYISSSRLPTSRIIIY